MPYVAVQSNAGPTASLALAAGGHCLEGSLELTGLSLCGLQVLFSVHWIFLLSLASCMPDLKARERQSVRHDALFQKLEVIIVPVGRQTIKDFR